jgi:hypothetical protein
MKILIILCLALIPFQAFAHEGHAEDCQAASTTASMFSCYNDVFKTLKPAWDVAEKNAAQAALGLDQVQSTDKNSNHNLAIDSRAKFEDYMKVECARQKNQYAGGTLAPLADITCRMSLMQHRIEMLKP